MPEGQTSLREHQTTTETADQPLMPPAGSHATELPAGHSQTRVTEPLHWECNGNFTCIFTCQISV